MALNQDITFHLWIQTVNECDSHREAKYYHFMLWQIIVLQLQTVHIIMHFVIQAGNVVQL